MKKNQLIWLKENIWNKYFLFFRKNSKNSKIMELKVILLYEKTNYLFYATIEPGEEILQKIRKDFLKKFLNSEPVPRPNEPDITIVCIHHLPNVIESPGPISKEQTSPSAKSTSSEKDPQSGHTCTGCLFDEPNQEAHMIYPFGCLL
jgi:hypothetical protein